MKIYSIRGDVKDYMMFVMSNSEILDLMPDFNIFRFGRPVNWKWVAPTGWFIQSDNKTSVIPKISTWAGSNLVLDDESKETIGSKVVANGEFLPVNLDDKQYWIYNPTESYEDFIVDIDKCEREIVEGEDFGIKTIAFRKSVENVDAMLFTLTINNHSKLYAKEAFKLMVEAISPQSLTFKRVY